MQPAGFVEGVVLLAANENLLKGQAMGVNPRHRSIGLLLANHGPQ